MEVVIQGLRLRVLRRGVLGHVVYCRTVYHNMSVRRPPNSFHWWALGNVRRERILTSILTLLSCTSLVKWCV